MREFDFNGLFILDLANNHQGDMEHALNIIRSLGRVVDECGARAALKFQFRDLDTLIHPAFRDRSDVKHIPRFLSTALTTDDYARLAAAVRECGMITMATPFDEPSVDMIEQLDIEVIKVASCSAADTPLLERVSKARRPVVISTGGLGISKTDRLVSAMDAQNVRFALMHCVVLYPTPRDKLCLNRIQHLRERFPKVPVGFSTHEDPDNYDAIRVAMAKGAVLFERHVGMATSKHELNAYSSTPDQVREWIRAYQDAVALCGGEVPSPSDPEEIASLETLMRGVYAAQPLTKGKPVARDQVYFAMPLQAGQLTSGRWRSGIVADADYEADAPLKESLATYEVADADRLFRIVLAVKGILNEAKIHVGPGSTVEVSHHYGLERFREFGCVIVNCVNREYCKKLIIQLPRQKHPYHYHAQKEETFQLLSGDMEIVLDGHPTRLNPGDTFLVPQMGWHKFHTLDGAIIEEVSTTHINDDSFYEDERISKFPREKRKTSLGNWTVLQSGL